MKACICHIYAAHLHSYLKLGAFAESYVAHSYGGEKVRES